MQHQTVVILGSTGSIGTQGLDVIGRHPERFTVAGLAAGGSNVDLLAQQAARFHVPEVVVANPDALEPLREALAAHGATGTQARAGRDEVNAIAGLGAYHGLYFFEAVDSGAAGRFAAGARQQGIGCGGRTPVVQCPDTRPADQSGGFRAFGNLAIAACRHA